MKKQTKRLLLILELLLILALAVGIFYFQKQAKQRDAILTKDQQEKRYVPSITYLNQSYPLKRNTSSLLLIGTDNFVDDDKQVSYDEYYHNGNLADFLVILVFDHTHKTVTPFQICRDTMCAVSRVNIANQPLPGKYMQITLSYSYGSGKEDSCINTRKSVENLLFKVPIDNFLSFTMDAVPLVNDLVGGVSVTLTSDIPALGEEYVEGATILLKGKNALRFVRYRDTELLDSNLSRMANHRLYADGFTVAARDAASKDPDLAIRIFKAANAFLCTDLSVDQVQEIVNNLVSYEILPFVYADGVYEFREGEQFPGFYVDEASLWSCVQSTFCQ